MCGERTAGERGGTCSKTQTEKRNLVIQDSTIIRLHESLAKIWLAARTMKIAAGVKVSGIINVLLMYY